MQTFLDKTASYLCEKYGDDIGDLCIVLPNRRAGLFLKNSFSNKLQKNFWVPEVMATEDFITLLSGLESTDNITLLFELYEVVKSIEGNEAESFDDFCKWGQTLLSDINEIDRYLVDAERLFGNLKDIKELETWSLNSDEGLTDFQKKYVNFWKSLGKYYFAFKTRLLAKKIAYPGLSYRIASDETEKRLEKHSWKKVIFAGFNALTKAEEKIIKQLLDVGKAEVFWDVDEYYTEDNKQEAGYFYRKYNLKSSFVKNLSEDNYHVFKENLLSSGEKKIEVIGTAKNVSQAKVAGNIIGDIKSTETSLKKTAVVLADENLLFPVLHSLPENTGSVNITMGYPLKSTPLSGYIDLLINLHINGSKSGKEKYSFYHKDILNFLNHPYTGTMVKSIGDNAVRLVKKITRTIEDKNIVFAGYSTLEKIISENSQSLLKVLLPLFTHWHTITDVLEALKYIIETLKEGIVKANIKKEEGAASLELEYLFAYTKIVKRMEVLSTDYPDNIVGLKAFQSIFTQIVRSTTLPFYGEPLMGLQVMGMLETRTLDFENVILLSCNENILPEGKSPNSFVPFELKRYFGMPTYSEKDAIFSYHFYRLLQRASNVYLIYNTESDALGKGEKSRFLTQLLYEFPKKNKNIRLEEKIVSVPVTINFKDEIIVSKTDKILDRLNEIAERGFSPSLLNVYNNCSLQFYFQSVAGLKEMEGVEENIGTDTLGNSVHNVLETLYQPFVGKVLKKEDIERMKKDVESLTLSFFENQYSKNEISYGKNYLTIKVALKFLNNFLNSEIKQLEEYRKANTYLTIKGLEEDLKSSIVINNLDVKIRGKADRIDAVGGVSRIVDYKTGVVNDKELRLTAFEELKENPELAKSFQLLTYAWLYQKNKPQATEDLVSGIITFRNLSAGLKKVKVNKQEELNANLLSDFEEVLKTILEDIFNREKSFIQTQDVNNCLYCSFKGICNR